MIRKHLNFIPQELRPRLKIPYQGIPVGFLLLFFLYAGSSMVRVSAMTYLNQKELTQLENTNSELSLKLKGMTEQTRIVDQNTESFKALQKVLERKNYWSEIFKEMSILIPDGVWLTNFSNRRMDYRIDGKTEPKAESKTSPGDQLVIRGESNSQMAIAHFLTVLEKSHHFSGARMLSSEKESNIKPSKYKFEFTIPVHASTGGNT